MKLLINYIVSNCNISIFVSFNIPDIMDVEDGKTSSNRGPFIVLGLIFISSLIAMMFVYTSFPELRP